MSRTLVVAALLLAALGVLLLALPDEESGARSAAGPAAERSEGAAREMSRLASNVRTAPAETPPTDRVEVEDATAREPSAPAKPPEDTATLVVLALRREGGTPLAGATLFAQPTDYTQAGWIAASARIEAVFDFDAATGADGRAEVRVPSDLALELLVDPPDDEELRTERVALTPLAPGERREVLVRLTGLPDRVVYVRFVEAEGGAPVEGVGLHVPDYVGAILPHALAEVEPLARSDADGRARVEVRSWLTPGVVAIAAGYGPLAIGLGAGYERPAGALEVALERSASVDATILGPDGRPAPGAHLEISISPVYLARPEDADFAVGQGPFAWGGRADDRGHIVIAELPPRVPLMPRAVSSGGDQDTGPPRESIILAPGEVREAEYSFGGLSRVVGVLRDPDGAPVPETTVWILATQGLEPGLISASDRGNLFQELPTEVDGEFVLGSVPEGHYAVFPAPPTSGQTATWAPLGTPFEVPPGAPEVFVEALAVPALSIGGRVVDPGGAPVDDTWVFTSALDRPGYLRTLTDEDGAFRVEGLVEGRYELRALGRGRLTDSEPLGAEAGDEELVLVLGAGATLRARLRGPDGPPEKGRALLTRPLTSEGAIAVGIDPDGELVVEGLPPGIWDVAFTTPTGLCGRLVRVQLDAGAEVGPLDVPLSAGGRLRLRYEGSERSVYFSVEQDGVQLDFDGLLSGTADVRTVPAGTLTVRFGEYSEMAGAKTVRVEPGEELEVVLD
jgi:hypothetical protein